MITREQLLMALSRHVGAGNGASAAALVREITGEPSTPEGERRLRDLVVELRMDGSHVCAHPSRGYFLAASDEEVNDTCLFLHDRALTSLRQVAAMKRVAVPDLKGQLRLPT